MITLFSAYVSTDGLGLETIPLTQLATFNPQLNVSVAPRYFTFSFRHNVVFRWSPYNLSSNASDIATLTFTSLRTNLITRIFVRDNGMFSESGSNFNYDYYRITVTNRFGTGSSIFANYGSNDEIDVAFPNSVTPYYTNSTNVLVQWNVYGFDLRTVLTINFVDLNTQLNYTFFNIKNNGSVVVDISTLNLPASKYTVYILGYVYYGPGYYTLQGEISEHFHIFSSGNTPAENGTDPGIYVINVENSFGTANSSDFVVYSHSGLNVSVDTSTQILPSGNLTIDWAPSANLSLYNATLILKNGSNYSISYTPVNVSDLGSSTIPLSSFGSDFPPSFYDLIVNGALGSGVSNSFLIGNASSLIVTAPTVITNVSDVGLLNILWDPSNPMGPNATLTSIDVSYPPTSHQFSSTDNGNSTIDLNSQSVANNKDLFTILPSKDEQKLPIKGLLKPRNTGKVKKIKNA